MHTNVILLFKYSSISISSDKQMALANTLEKNSQCYEVQVTNTRLVGRAGMVEHQHVQVEQQSLLEEGHRSSDRFQCIPGGMGCLLLRTEDRGPWSHQECRMHINRLKLLGTLAIKMFAKSKTAISVLLRINNTTTVAYINNLGGTASKELVVRDLWM